MIKIVELLLQVDGINVDSKDIYGRTPMDLAELYRNNEIINILEKHKNGEI